MDPKHLLGFVLALHFAGNVLATNEYFYEFGTKNIGRQIFTKEGEVHLFQYNNYIQIPVPADTEVSYVSVTVNALNPPKVDYNDETRTLSIKYSLLEIPVSSYSIFAKGVQNKTIL